jgi:hypothetical protein
MMLENLLKTFVTTLPWPQVLIGVAAALAVLVIYDVCYVWPIHRRIGRLVDRVDGLERSLSGLLDALAARVAASDHRGREDLGRLGERLGQLELATEARSYEQAICSAERGEERARLMNCFGLTEGEADLVTLLHGDQARRFDLMKSA